ncbi:MAG: DUF4038 domain-containing protein, partial [Planctomycetes bacterium]|nr:DUF4038 domain-containing protein [Planctomycetota bacterium]
MYTVWRNCVLEFSFQSRKAYKDPSNDVELDVVFRGPDGAKRRVPAFWAGEDRWTVRFSSPELGEHAYQSVCSDEENQGLHGAEGVIRVRPYEGANALYVHGPLRVSSNRKYLEHEDATPFLWLGDTWWYGLSKRLSWPEDFRLLVADRAAKGFSVIQIVAGPYPGVAPTDRKYVNEAGFPWEGKWDSINPAYFDLADLRIEHIVS